MTGGGAAEPARMLGELAADKTVERGDRARRIDSQIVRERRLIRDEPWIRLIGARLVAPPAELERRLAAARLR
jgi:hypothetical protein